MLKYGKDNDKELQVPARLAIGITAFLCGAFLVCVPLPYCTASGLCLIGWGAQQSAEAIINELENNEKRKTQKELFLNFS